jgi:DNA-binding NtrC family response regulator
MDCLKVDKLEKSEGLTLPQKSVLIIDDYEAMLNTFSRLLKRFGYATDTARTGKEALAKVFSRLFHAALIEIDLPEEDGNELILKLSECDSKMIKIVLTDNQGVSSIATDRGVDAILIKPVNPAYLLSVLKEKLGS